MPTFQWGDAEEPTIISIKMIAEYYFEIFRRVREACLGTPKLFVVDVLLQLYVLLLQGNLINILFVSDILKLLFHYYDVRLLAIQSDNVSVRLNQISLKSNPYIHSAVYNEFPNIKVQLVLYSVSVRCGRLVHILVLSQTSRLCFVIFHIFIGCFLASYLKKVYKIL